MRNSLLKPSAFAFAGAFLAALLATLAAFGDIGTSRGHATTGDAGAFVVRLVWQVAEGRYALAWRSLHPAQRHAVPQADYVLCESLDAFPGMSATTTIVRVFQERVRVAGLQQSVASTAVTARVVVTAPRQKPYTFTKTFHALRAGAGWSWILPPERYAAYRSKSCPSAYEPTWRR